MSSIFSPPKPPDPLQVAAQQDAFNVRAAQEQQRGNMFNQTTPFGTLNYASDPNSPSGYSANVALAPGQQAILDQLIKGQLTTGGAGQNLATTARNLSSNIGGMYSTPFDLQGPTGATAQMLNKWQSDYLAPIFKQQQSNLDAQLQNQGLTPGSTAYNNAQNLLARNQGDITNQYLTMNQGQAFNQALTQYGLPLQTENALLSAGKGAFSSPTSPSFVNPPQAQIQPANYESAAQNAYQAKQNQYNAQIQGLGQLAGIVAAPFTGGLSMIPGMFSSAPMSLGGGWSSGSVGGTGGGLGGFY